MAKATRHQPGGWVGNAKASRVATPATAHCMPVGGGSKRWAATCYKCRHLDTEDDRELTIKAHKEHYEREHAR